MTIHPVIILGSGPAGLSAAIYAARANHQPLVIEGLAPGGQLMTTTGVENWPGDLHVMGPELMMRMREHAQSCGAKLISDHIEAVSLLTSPFKLTGSYQDYFCDSLIIATGASARYLGLPSEKAYLGRGVSACATCDGFFFRDKVVVVVGGGNTAVEEALYLSQMCQEVILIHRRHQLRAEPVLIERLKALKNVRFLWSHIVLEVLGDGQQVSGVQLKDLVEEKTVELTVDGVFIAIGHNPNTELFAEQLQTDNGYLKIGFHQRSTATSKAGVFAAGDVADPVYRQAITSAGAGCMAALDVNHYLQNRAI